ncbi:acyl-CoA dehydrogenase family protein [Botrimarina mediterranea]|uniref:Acryloyl-CoA reductase (NADH) n=1 Tax=Botrimarina mediterranea TaxID=2528022 RepID=A0A518K7T8_9BACT|nr:acyl-CoA dehydrogenase family protein [Botrimarina mediterranea]QDV73851.1 Acryloyl-CoA reductase (NADH) [Botrimarina mediterranea]QDV78481.1 Acryloyl-CoA reductase (NADH) [Planctomycetes bacterium K2D]
MRLKLCGGVGLLLIALACLPANAQTDLGGGNSEAALLSLQDRQRRGDDAFVLQSDLNAVIRQGGGGACASAAAIDAVQALRLMAGLEPIENPHRAALEAFAVQDELLNGRVTNEQLIRLLQGYAKKHLRGWELRVEVASTPHRPFSPQAEPWATDEAPDLTLEPGTLKIVTYNVTTSEGELLGRHFVLLKSVDGDTLYAVDPQSPLRSTSFTLEPRDTGKWGNRIFLIPPAKANATSTNELDTVFTLLMRKSEATVGAPATLEQFRASIDRTAYALREEGNLRSPREWRKRSAAFGLPGLDLPEELGGSAWPPSKMLEVFIHAGRHNLNSRDVVGGAHVRPLLVSQDERVRGIVKQVARGEGYMAITMTEPHAGSDYYAIKSTARQVDGGYLLSGEKRYVARLEQATHVIIFTQPANGLKKGLSAFVLPIDAPGLERYSFEAHGLKGNSFGGLRFKDIRVENWQMLGGNGEGSRLFIEHFRCWRLMQVAAALGTAEQALEQMAERLTTREAYGGPIGRFTHLQQQLGQRTTELRMAKALAREAAEMLDRGDGEAADPLINGLKAEGVEIALAAVDAATRAFGAEGYSGNVDLGERLQDLNGLRIADGTTDVMRMDVVRRSYQNGKELWDLAVKRKP